MIITIIVVAAFVALSLGFLLLGIAAVKEAFTPAVIRQATSTVVIETTSHDGDCIGSDYKVMERRS